MYNNLRSSDGSQSYLSYWDGHTWNELSERFRVVLSKQTLIIPLHSSINEDPGFADSTDVSQLVMVPLQNTHDANGVIETDRMLMVSGTISGPSFGNASSVLFDGKDFIPYILSSSSTGTPGAVSSLIHSISRIDFTQRRESQSSTKLLTLHTNSHCSLQTSSRLASSS